MYRDRVTFDFTLPVLNCSDDAIDAGCHCRRRGVWKERAKINVQILAHSSERCVDLRPARLPKIVRDRRRPALRGIPIQSASSAILLIIVGAIEEFVGRLFQSMAHVLQKMDQLGHLAAMQSLATHHGHDGTSSHFLDFWPHMDGGAHQE